MSNFADPWNKSVPIVHPPFSPPGQVVLEMIEVREVDTARAMLRQTQVFARMRQEDPERFLRLEQLTGKTYFDVRCAVRHAVALTQHLSVRLSERPSGIRVLRKGTWRA
jgi:hypothetical protein